MQLFRMRFFLSSPTAILLLSVTLSVYAWGTETVVYRFAGSPDGANPASGLINDSAGTLYGTTTTGGMYGAGSVYELSYSASTGLYTETVLYSFTGGSDGGTPVASLVFDPAGNLYGTTKFGGAGTCSAMASGCGVVFKLSEASGYSAETVLYRFNGGIDGGLPVASLAIDSAGNLYGTASCGGSSSCSAGNGVVFELPASNPFSETVLYTFPGGASGSTPVAAVLLDSAGNLYGTTEFGGGGMCSGTGCGIVYELLAASAYHSEVILHTFTGSTDGGLPLAPLAADGSGNLYGTASCGGIATMPCSSGSGNGVVFEINSLGLTVVHKFSAAGTAGAKPKAAVVFDNTFSYLYGTTFQGGADNLGVVYRIRLAGFLYANLHSYSGETTGDGANPTSAVTYLAPGLDPLGKIRVMCPKGCAYETTSSGGTDDQGVVSNITPASDPSSINNLAK